MIIIVTAFAAVLSAIYFGAFGPIVLGIIIYTNFIIGQTIPSGSLALRVILSGIGVTAASGKISGTVFVNGKTTTYCRVKVKPANPRTTFQTTSRTNFKINSQAWRSLTAVQRAGWNAAVINFPRHNKLGTVIQLSGAQLFCSFNNNLLASGATTITSAPIPTTVLTPITVTLTTLAGVISVLWTSGAIPASTSFQVWATPGVSVGKSFVKSQFRLLQVIATGGTSPTVITTAYSARFGAYIVGTKIFAYLVAVSTTTGIRTTSNTTSLIAT